MLVDIRKFFARLFRKEPEKPQPMAQEPVWLVDLGNGDTCYVPESSVVVLPEGV